MATHPPRSGSPLALLCLLPACFLFVHLAGAQCINYSETLKWMGWASTEYSTISVAGDGHYAYVVDGLSLLVFDLTDPAHPNLVASHATAPYSRDLLIQGSLAYLATGESGLTIFDISNPLAPAPLGGVDTQRANALAVDGGYAYVADDAGLVIVSVADPSHPTIVGSLPTYSAAVSVAVSGRYCFVGEQYYGTIDVVDCLDPSAPSVVTTMTVHTPWDLALSGNLLLAADDQWGVVIHDVTDPLNPVWLGYCLTWGIAADLAVTGTIAMVGDGEAGVTTVDFSDPANPVVVGSLAVRTRARKVAVLGSLGLVAAQSGGLQVVSLVDVESPWPVGMWGAAAGNMGIVATDDYLYLSALASGLRILSLADPSHPILLGTANTSGLAYDVALAGSHAIVADYWNGVAVVNVADPAHPVITGTLALTAWPQAVAVSGTLAYLATDNGGYLHIVDFSAPSAPSLRGSVSMYYDAMDVAIAGDYAYVANERDGLRIIDVSNPDAPFAAAQFDPEEEVWSVTVEGSYAYLGEEWGLRIVDISNPLAPVSVGRVELPDLVYHIAIQDGIAYLANFMDALSVVDVSAPTAPVYLGSAPAAGSDCHGSAANGTHAFVTDNQRGVFVFPLHCPTSSVDSELAWSVPDLHLSPNPSRPGPLAFDLSLPREGVVGLRMFDPAGREVGHLEEARLPAGERRIVWDPWKNSPLSPVSGVYWLQLSAGDSKQTTRCVIVR